MVDHYKTVGNTETERKTMGDQTEKMNNRNMQRAKQNNNINSITMFKFNIS